MPPRAVFFNRSFYPDVTATGQLLTELCLDLVKEYGWSVTVVTGQPLVGQYAAGVRVSRKGLWQKETLEGVEIVRVSNSAFGPESFLGRVFNYLTYFILSFLASFRLKKHDIVITLTDPPIIVLLGLWVGFWYKIPFVVSLRDLFPEAARGLEGREYPCINILLDQINRFCLKKATHVVVLGKTMQNRLIEDKGISQDTISIIHDWADTAAIIPLPKENAFAIRHHLADYFVLMYAGNIGASSGLEFVIDTAVALKEHKDILFVFVGEGIIKQRLIGLAEKRGLANVRFFPFQPKQTLSEVFSSADVFLVPLKKGLGGYSIPSKVYTVLASGRPYLACVDEDSEIARITREFGCGLLSAPQDPEGLARNILSLFQQKHLRQTLGQNARKASAFFDRRLGAQQYRVLFERLLHDKKGT